MIGQDLSWWGPCERKYFFFGKIWKVTRVIFPNMGRSCRPLIFVWGVRFVEVLGFEVQHEPCYGTQTGRVGLRFLYGVLFSWFSGSCSLGWVCTLVNFQIFLHLRAFSGVHIYSTCKKNKKHKLIIKIWVAYHITLYLTSFKLEWLTRENTHNGSSFFLGLHAHFAIIFSYLSLPFSFLFRGGRYFLLIFSFIPSSSSLVTLLQFSTFSPELSFSPGSGGSYFSTSIKQ